jgi:hypothetical protein
MFDGLRDLVLKTNEIRRRNKIMKKIIFGFILCCLVILCLSVGQTFAQPTDAQIKKDLTGAKTVSVTLGQPGKIEWSKTYFRSHRTGKSSRHFPIL